MYKFKANPIPDEVYTFEWQLNNAGQDNSAFWAESIEPPLNFEPSEEVFHQTYVSAMAAMAHSPVMTNTIGELDTPPTAPAPTEARQPTPPTQPPIRNPDFWTLLQTKNYIRAVEIACINSELVNNLHERISLAEANNFFMQALRSRAHKVVANILSNRTLVAYITGSAVTNANGESEQKNMTEQLVEFIYILKSENRSAIRTIWEKNPMIRSCFAGNKITLKPITVNGQPYLHLVQLNFANQLEAFNSALSSHISPIIKEIWEKNSLLATYFKGNTIALPNPINPTGSFPLRRIASRQELLTHFQKALSSHCRFVIEGMWMPNNAPIKALLPTLTKSELITLTKKILISKLCASSEVPDQFLEFIQDPAILKTALEECNCPLTSSNQPPLSTLKKVQNRLARLTQATTQPVNTNGFFADSGDRKRSNQEQEDPNPPKRYQSEGNNLS